MGCRRRFRFLAHREGGAHFLCQAFTFVRGGGVFLCIGAGEVRERWEGHELAAPDLLLTGTCNPSAASTWLDLAVVDGASVGTGRQFLVISSSRLPTAPMHVETFMQERITREAVQQDTQSDAPARHGRFARRAGVLAPAWSSRPPHSPTDPTARPAPPTRATSGTTSGSPATSSRKTTATEPRSPIRPPTPPRCVASSGYSARPSATCRRAAPGSSTSRIWATSRPHGT